MVNLRISALYALVLSCLYCIPAFSSDLGRSAANSIADNPFVAYGVNPTTKVVTGYLRGLRTSPGRTDDCRFSFAGNFDNPRAFSVKYLSEIDGYEPNGTKSPASIKSVDGNIVIDIKKDEMGGDCEWILPFIGEPRVKESRGQVLVSFGNLSQGDWGGVFAIRSTRAFFYKSPDESSPQKSFLIQGDYIYVFDEKPDWYFVKYNGRKREIAGWVKKSDTVQVLK